MGRVKRILEAVGIETLLIVIVIAVIVGILSYLNIIPLRQFFTQTSTPTDQNRKVKVGYKPLNQPTVLEAPDLFFTSDIPGYSLSADKSRLGTVLEGWNVYGYLQSRNRNVPVESITIHLTDKVQPGDQFSNPGKGILMSSDLQLSNNKAQVYIQEAPALLNNATVDLSAFFTDQFLKSMYMISHPGNAKLTPQNIYDNMTQEVQKIDASGNSIFTVRKN